MVRAVTTGSLVETEETLFVLCSCHSPEHQMILSYFNDEDIPYRELTVQFHLSDMGFWRRLKYGIKYIFGYRSKYGAFSELILSDTDVAQIEEFLMKYRNEPKKER